jgi:hypothetical protein
VARKVRIDPGTAAGAGAFTATGDVATAGDAAGTATEEGLVCPKETALKRDNTSAENNVFDQQVTRNLRARSRFNTEN